MRDAPELSARLAYGRPCLDRHAERRDDLAFLADQDSHPRARSFVLAGETPILKGGRDVDPLFPLGEVAGLGEAFERIFLGTDALGPVYGTLVEASAAERLKDTEGYVVTDLRSIAVQGILVGAPLAGLGMAKSLTGWHARHRFCANCGAPTSAAPAGWKRVCAACGAEHFPRTDPVTIMLVTHGDRCLLGRQPRFPPGMHSCLAGFLEPGESIEDAARREVFEEAGIRCGKAWYMAAQPWPFPSSLMIGVRLEAIDDEITIDPNELESARWFSRAEVRQMLDRSHPDGLMCPPPSAIAHQLMLSFVAE